MPMKSRRSLKNVLNQPAAHLRISAYVALGVGLVIVALVAQMAWIFYSMFQSVVANLSLSQQAEQFMGRGLLQTFVIFVVLVMGSSLVFFYLMLRMSHSFFGPLVPLNRLLDELQRGNYSARGRLRKGDQLQDIMEKLNRLAAKLEAEAGKQAPPS